MDIRPFRGWRYATGPEHDVGAFLAPPYDVLSAEDKQALVGRCDRNIVVADMPHVPPTEAGADEVYARAADTIRHWQGSGVLGQEQAPALYAYEQEFRWAGKTYVRRAMICGVRATDFGKDVIPHEHTFAGPKADRLKLTQHTRLQLSPILGFFHDPQGQAGDLLWGSVKGPPDAAGVLRDVGERLWVVRDPITIRHIAAVVRDVPVFIADGHHRYTTAMNYRDQLRTDGRIDDGHEANFVMFALVRSDDPGMLILPTHRIVRGMRSDFSFAGLISRAPEFSWQRLSMDGFDFRDAAAALRRHGRHAMAFFEADPSEIWIAKPKDAQAMKHAAPDQSDVWRNLDVAILHKLIIDKAIEPWRSENFFIEYTPDASAALSACHGGRGQLGILLQGTPIEAVEAVARGGGAMPHKSTYFYPKLATGMVIKPLE